MLAPKRIWVIPRRLLIWIAVIWTVVLVAGSLSTAETKNAIGTTRAEELPVHIARALPPGDLKHRVFHWGSFGVTALLYLLLVEGVKAEALAAGSAAVLGVAIEIAQYSIYYIRFEWDDVVDDTVAVAVVYAVVVAYRRWRKRTGVEGHPGSIRS